MTVLFLIKTSLIVPSFRTERSEAISSQLLSSCDGLAAHVLTCLFPAEGNLYERLAGAIINSALSPATHPFAGEEGYKRPGI